MNTKILNAFSDFVLVGVGRAKLKDDGSLDKTYVAPHDDKRLTQPEEIEKGIEYVFHHSAPLDNESLALRELPERLSQLGFKITDSPKSTEDLLYLVYGGPLFVIRFSDGKHEGIIFNQVHMMGNEHWADHDYVLFYTR